jgi:hypothetical protein
MIPADSFKELLSIVARRLVEADFRRKGNTFYLRQADNWGIVNFQKSGKSTAEVILLTVNIGAALGVLLEFSGIRASDLPCIDECQWRKRLGFFSPEPSDTWWRIDATTSPTVVGAEILDALLRLAVPEMKKFMSDANLRALWASGEAPGLTEVERLKHLSVLLKLAATSTDALDDARTALQTVSDGRPSAAAVAVHLMRLDKLHNA